MALGFESVAVLESSDDSGAREFCDKFDIRIAFELTRILSSNCNCNAYGCIYSNIISESSQRGVIYRLR